MTGVHLGVSIGTANTTAAISRGGPAEIVMLGGEVPWVPTVAFLAADGTVSTGLAALRAGAAEPERLRRDFLRRLGSPEPAVTGGPSSTAAELTAAVLRDVVAAARSRTGKEPDWVTLVRPATWDRRRSEALESVPTPAGVRSPITVTTIGQAVATAFAAANSVRPGGTVAVFHLGAGQFETVALASAATVGTAPAGAAVVFDDASVPEGMPDNAGDAIDEIIFAYVCQETGIALGEMAADPAADPAVQSAADDLLVACRAAKEELTLAGETTIRVRFSLPHTEIRLSREQLEILARPILEPTIGTLRRVVAAAGGSVGTVLLDGGSVRIPLLSRLIEAAGLGPVAPAPHPELTAALGAALIAARDAGEAGEAGGDGGDGAWDGGWEANGMEPPTARYDLGPVSASRSPEPPAHAGSGGGSVIPVSDGPGRYFEPAPPGRADLTEILLGPAAAERDAPGWQLTGTGESERAGSGGRRRALIALGSAAVVVIAAVALVVARPWDSTVVGRAATGVISSGSGASAPATARSAGSRGASGTPTTGTSGTATGANPAGMPTGVICDPVSLAYLGMLIDPSVSKPDGTGDDFRPGELAAGMETAGQLAVGQFNAVNPGCQVTLSVLNTENDPKKARGLAHQAVADPSVLGVVAGVFSAEVAAVGDTLQAAGLPFITPSAKSPDLNAKKWADYARDVADDRAQGPAAAKYLTDTVGAGAVAVVDDGGAYGKPIAKAVATGLGSALASTATIAGGPDGLSTVVSAITGSGADAVYFAGRPTTGGRLLAALRAAGYQGTFLAAEALNTPRLLGTAGKDAAQGAMFSCSCAPPDISAQFLAGYKAAAGGADPPAYAPEAYDATRIFLKGLAAGARERPAMAAYVRAFSGEGISKQIAFDANGNIVGTPTYFYRIDSGRPVPAGFVP